MGLIGAVLVSVLVGAVALITEVIAKVIARVLADDIKEWLPWVRERLIERAVARLPEDQRARYAEEWRSYLNEIPGDLSKIVEALRLGDASRSITGVIYSGDPLSVSERIQDTVRRAFDIAMSLTVLFLCLPCLIAAMIAIQWDSPGPVFDRQKCVGRNGRVFWKMKLRTTDIDSTTLSSRNDPGDSPIVTRISKLIRESRIDELPLLINVLRGDMGFVGPRPERPEFSEELAENIPEYLHRNKVKPGLTGLAQIRHPYGASLEDAKQKFQHDKFYLRHRSLWLDIYILRLCLRAALLPGRPPT